MTLFETVEVMRELLRRVDEAEGEVSPELEAKLESCTSTIESKVEAYALLTRQLEGEASGCESVAVHYHKRGQRLLAQRQQLMQRLFEAMQLLDVKRIAAATATATIQQSPPKLVMKDTTAAMALGYVVHHPDTLDTQRIKGELLTNPDSPLASVASIERAEHLRIR